MPTSYTSLLGFALPVTGELSGTWGDVVNNSITELVEDSIAGSVTASVASGDWTLTTTGSGIANQARSAILIPTGTPGVSRNIIAPSSSKAYVVNNKSNAAVVVKGAATTGATVAAGTTALVAWDGADFVLVAQNLANVSGTLAATNGGTGQSSYAVGDIVYASTTTALSKLADVATGNALISGGVNTAPAYGKIGLTTHVSGTLPIANGGTGATTRQDAMDALAGSVTSGQYLRGNGTDVVMSTIQAADVPTLNQNTTGTAANVTGTVAVVNGGTGQTTYTNGQLLIGNTTGNTLVKSTLTAGSGVAITNGAGTITIAATGTGGTVTSIDVSGGTTGLTTSGGPITGSGTITMAGTLAATNGGTGQTSYAVGDIVYASTTTALSKLADVATGNALISGGVGVAPSYGKIGLTTHVSGTLPVANGGTGATTSTGTGAVVLASSPTIVDLAITGTILEDVYTITDGAAFEIDPANGSIQIITLGDNRTPKATNFAAGEAITLMVDDGSAYTITWTDATFGGSGVIWETDEGVAPTLSTTGYTTIILWKVSTQVYGARVGNA